MIEAVRLFCSTSHQAVGTGPARSGGGKGRWEEKQANGGGTAVSEFAANRILFCFAAAKMPERKNLSGNKSIPMGSHLLGMIGLVRSADHQHVIRNKFHFLGRKHESGLARAGGFSPGPGGLG